MTSPSSIARHWLPVIFWMGIIFLGSTDYGSAARTKSFVNPFLRWLFHNWLSADAMGNVHMVIRKTWHLIEYSILGALLWRAFYAEPGAPASQTPDRSWKWPAAKAVLVAALYAAGDEYHQSFVPSRSSSVHDVVIDTIGAAAGVTVIALATRSRVRLAAPSHLPDKA